MQWSMDTQIRSWLEVSFFSWFLALALDSNPKKERETRHAPKRKERWMRPELVCTMSPSNQRAQTIDDAIPQISLSVSVCVCARVKSMEARDHSCKQCKQFIFYGK